MSRKLTVENLIRKILNEKEENIGGPFRTDLENGPKNHGARALGNWQSDNAWDVFAPAGTVVNSYTDGVVKKVRDTGKNSGKIYGTQVTIKGEGDFPEIFYTHLKNVKLKVGDTVKVGDRIGEVSEWIGHDKMTHVHIGLPRGNHLRDLLKNSKDIFNKKGSSEESEKTSDSEEDKKQEKIKKPKTGLENIGDYLSFLRTGIMPTKTSDIGNTLDDETSNIGNSLDDENTSDQNQDETATVNISNYTITEPSSADKDFYTQVLKKINAPISKQNLLFFYAWRQAEGAKSTYNPFNTTQPKEGASLWNCLKKKDGVCVGGVRNYKTKEDGIDATVKTITNGNYKCIVDGLKSDKGASQIATCSDLKKWGTGGGITRVLNTKKINPPAISSTVVKSIKESFNNEKERISDLIKKVL